MTVTFTAEIPCYDQQGCYRDFHVGYALLQASNQNEDEDDGIWFTQQSPAKLS